HARLRRLALDDLALDRELTRGRRPGGARLHELDLDRLERRQAGAVGRLGGHVLLPLLVGRHRQLGHPPGAFLAADAHALDLLGVGRRLLAGLTAHRFADEEMYLGDARLVIDGRRFDRQVVPADQRLGELTETHVLRWAGVEHQLTVALYRYVIALVV